MDSTAQLGLPLVMPAQAQKHVTVNEALAKLDALAQLRLASLRLTVPPANSKQGQSYFISGQGEGAWAGQTGKIATAANGGWTFANPAIGWSAWDEESKTRRVFDGNNWIKGAVAVTSSGAATCLIVDEFDHIFEPGSTNTTTYELPRNALVLGVTGRVRVDVQGNGLSSWRLGVPTAEGRYGTSLGTSRNSYVLGISSSPMAYYEAAPLLLSAETGDFMSGMVSLAVHYARFSIPNPD